MIPKLDALVTGEEVEKAREVAREIERMLHELVTNRRVVAGSRKGADKRLGDKAVAALFAKLSGPLPEAGAS
jgi:hypothetical protein